MLINFISHKISLGSACSLTAHLNVIGWTVRASLSRAWQIMTTPSFCQCLLTLKRQNTRQILACQWSPMRQTLSSQSMALRKQKQPSSYRQALKQVQYIAQLDVSTPIFHARHASNPPLLLLPSLSHPLSPTSPKLTTLSIIPLQVCKVKCNTLLAREHQKCSCTLLGYLSGGH